MNTNQRIIVLFVLFLPITSFSQKLIVVDTVTGVTRYIRPGQILVATTKDVSMDEQDLTSYRDSTYAPGIWLHLPDGAWRLTEIDTVNKTIDITVKFSNQPDVKRTVKLSDILYIIHVRTKDPRRAMGRRIYCFLGGLVSVGAIIAGPIEKDADISLVGVGSLGIFTALFVHTGQMMDERAYWYRGIASK